MYAHSGGMWPGDSAETRAPRARRHAKIQITAKLCRRASGLGWSRDSPTPTSVSAVVCTAQLSTYWTRCMKPWSARYLNANRSDRPLCAVAGRTRVLLHVGTGCGVASAVELSRQTTAVRRSSIFIITYSQRQSHKHMWPPTQRSGSHVPAPSSQGRGCRRIPSVVCRARGAGGGLLPGVSGRVRM